MKNEITKQRHMPVPLSNEEGTATAKEEGVLGIQCNESANMGWTVTVVSKTSISCFRHLLSN